MRAPGSHVTYAPDVRAGSCGRKSGSTRTEPVKYSAGPLVEGCDPLRVICIVRVPDNGACADVRLPAAIAPKLAASAKMDLRVNTRYRIGAAAVRRCCVFDFWPWWQPERCMWQDRMF